MLREKYNLFGIASAVYAVFLTFCLYQNTKGVTFPFFVAGTLCYFCYCMKKCGVVLKKDDLCYFLSLMLLGISVFLTMDSRILFFARTGIFLLFTAFLLQHFYHTKHWSFTKYLESILEAVIYAIGSFCYPVKDLIYYVQEKKKPKTDADGNPLPKEESKLKYFLLGAAISVPLLIIVLLALSQADAVFGNLLEDFFDLIQIDTVIKVVLLTLFGYFASYSVLHSLVKRELKEDCTGNRTKEPIIAITFTSVISVVYLIFCVIQILYLFMGNMQLPEGYTYAQYAKQGFYELLFVCVMNLIILLVCISLFKESNILKGILSVITVCTYIMIASSAYRMYLYVDAYHLTFLRLFVFFSLFVIAVLMVGIFITIFRDGFPLFRYCMVAITIFTIILSYSHPDYLIAKYNLKHMTPIVEEGNTYRDVSYLCNHLCADAAPVLLQPETFKHLLEVEPNQARWYYDDCYSDYEDGKMNVSLRTFNLSTFRYKKAFETLQQDTAILSLKQH